MSFHSSRIRLRAFTLVELLVVIAIIGILIALLLPAVQQAREAARRMQCTNNLKQMGLACHNYMDIHQENLPSGAFKKDDSHGWALSILPFLEQTTLYDQYDFSKGPTANENQAIRRTVVNAFICPSFDGKPSNTATAKYSDGALLTYQGVHGVYYNDATKDSNLSGIVSAGLIPSNGIFRINGTRKASEITDGLTNTIMIGDFIHRDRSGTNGGFPGNVRVWLVGAYLTVDGIYNSKAIYEDTINSRRDRANDGVAFNHIPFSSRHPGGVNFAIADGSVRFVPETINFDAYCAAATINGSETFPLP
ncbi:DUF1559 domain-containing protein [Bremerella alba]|uniref:DUF1559 domain-containing protein n=1 Tax=Bremerella alba TaxID=980252 RepID=A0A7V9A6N4_9BACT|nr:DUF1559 domain-containing protein [Bremerella alba]MBA2114141.1 hypothetical protein [Bremerella alba]